MSEPTSRCSFCCGLGRVADAPCRMCNGSGEAPTPTVRCPTCRGDRADDFGEECAECRGTGSVRGCAECLVLPMDPMFKPCCGGTCLDAWQAKQRLATQAPPLVRKAP